MRMETEFEIEAREVVVDVNSNIHSNGSFPLTPALFLGERENPSPSLDCSVTTVHSPLIECFGEQHEAGDATRTVRITRMRQPLSPLPEGEGKGEGKGREQKPTAHFRPSIVR
jgi:hypothetical protein